MNLRNMIIKIHICLIAFCFISGIKAQTQNSMTEIIPSLIPQHFDLTLFISS